MDYFSWLAVEAQYTDAALTVRAQNLPPLEQDRLLWDIFFPRTNADGMNLSELITSEFRPASDRREWNTRGRLIPVQTPTRAELQFIPIESYFKVEEQEINALLERTLGNNTLIRQLLNVSVPDRTDGLVQSNFRRMELDALQAWHSGTVTVMNPQTGFTYTATYGMDATRYQTAATPWDATTVNAYDEFVAWIEAGQDVVPGGIVGVVLRRNDYRAIHEDAPQGIMAIPLSRGQFEDQLAQTLGFRVQFYILENWLDVAVDGGLEFTRKRVWKPGAIAAIPSGTAVGRMNFAPVARAFELARVNTDAEIDIRGMSVFKEIAGNGRELTVECQVNSYPVPNEQKIWVMNSGIASSSTA